MNDAVIGTPSVVGFTTDNQHRYGGWSAKDTMFASAVDRGEQTRDIMQMNRFESAQLREAVYANAVAIEKVGMANQIATEKIGAAAVLAAETQAHALALQCCDLKSSILLEMQKCCCDIRQDVAGVKETVLATDAARIRDALQQAQTELLLRRGNGNNGS